MAESELTTPRGTFEVTRLHTAASSPLRAWSAADQLVLDELGQSELGRLLIVNDEFGALTVGLHDAAPVVWGDSALSRAAIEKNLAENTLEPLDNDQVMPGHVPPDATFDTVVVRVPKTTSLLNYQLGHVRRCCAPGARIIGTGMVRHIHTSTVAAFENLIGVTHTSRATRKARLIHSEPTATMVPAPGPEGAFETDRGVRVAEGPGTFSAGHLDVGSALLLQVLGEIGPPADGSIVADLGCGNGVLAATAASWWPGASFRLYDASDLAVATARRTWQLNDLAPDAMFVAADGLADVADRTLDVVISNPPFHQGHALDAELTMRLLADCARALAVDGVAYIVVQRHLNLHSRLRQWFDSVEVASKHPSHVVLKATGPRSSRR